VQTPPPGPGTPGTNGNGSSSSNGLGNGYRPGAGPAPGPGPGPGSGLGAGSGSGSGPGYDDQPGHTRAFTVADPPDAYAPQQAGPVPPVRPAEEERVTTYRAGQSHPRVSGTRMPWRPLITGMYRHPRRTFTRMRTHQVWGPALSVSALYGVLAVFAFGDSRSDVVDSSFTLSLLVVVSSAVGIILAGLMFGAVTHALARRLGGDGAWMSTIGLAMLIMWTTAAPQMLFSWILGAGNGIVQVLGWGIWALCAWLLTTMVREVHDLPWGKAAAAAGVQLIALLLIIKLPTLG